MDIRNLKGVEDFSPITMTLRNKITDILRTNFEAYGYQPIDTAMLNYRDLLTYKYGDTAEIVKEIYALSDQRERDLGLRFDLTVPFCKYISLNRNMKLPFKRYEFGKVFRNGPVKAGRLREFVQCDIDVVGDNSRLIEAELIELAIKSYLQMGITPNIQIGNRKLLVALIENAGAKSNIEQIIGILDKIKKVERSETLSELEKFLPKINAEMLVSNIELDINKLEKILPNNEGILEIIELFKLLKSVKLDRYCTFTPSLARGLNVYTGMVWEVFDATKKYTSSLGGGGRYDNIITNFVSNGVLYPAVGMSFGLEPISAILSSQTAQNLIQVMIVPMGTFGECSAIANHLRTKSVHTMLWTSNSKVGKALEYASATKIKYVIVIGENEVTNNQLKIKNMESGEQIDFSFTDIDGMIKYIENN